MAALVAACSQPSGDELLPPLDETSDQTPAAPTSTTSTTSTPSTEPEPPPSDLADLEVLWASLIAVTEPAIETEREAAVDELGSAVDPDVAAIAVNILGGGDRAMSTETTTNTVLVERLNQRVEIEDCVFYDPGVLGTFAHRYTGVADPDGDGGWVITGIQRQQDDCIPADTAQTIYDAYNDYVNTGNEYWANPPNPDHPGIDQTLTGNLRDLIRERVAQSLDEGWYVHDEDVTHPEITRLILPTRVEITDCREMDPASGVFDTQGERTLGSEPAESGDRVRFDIIMVLEGGTWKAQDAQIHLDSDCETAPTHLATPIVG